MRVGQADDSASCRKRTSFCDLSVTKLPSVGSDYSSTPRSGGIVTEGEQSIEAESGGRVLGERHLEPPTAEIEFGAI